MAKSNPLKTFNDTFAKRKEGMAKALVKAQFGFTKFQGPVTQDASEQIANELANQPMPVAQYNTRVIADKNRTSTPYSNSSVATQPMKKGGAVKSKKK